MGKYSAFFLVNETLIFLESIENPSSSIFCVGTKMDLPVSIEYSKLLSKSIIAFILFIHSCLVFPCKQESALELL